MTMENLDNVFDEELNLTDVELEQPIIDEETAEQIDIFSNPQEPKIEEPSILDDLLKLRGINDRKITILDENEEEKIINFSDLSKEDQLEILSQNDNSIENFLDDTEIEVINHLRQNNLSMADFLEQYRASILNEIGYTGQESYDIDNYDDKEIFLLDLKNKFDLTEDELALELEKELKNPDLFTKKTSKLREEYKKLEDEIKIQRQNEYEATQQKQYNEFATTMNNISQNIEDFHGIYLEEPEKIETLKYLLELDDSGMSKFSIDLNTPEKLYEAAWYLRYGKEAFKAIEDAYEEEIKKLKQDKQKVTRKPNEVKNINDL